MLYHYYNHQFFIYSPKQNKIVRMQVFTILQLSFLILYQRLPSASAWKVSSDEEFEVLSVNFLLSLSKIYNSSLYFEQRTCVCVCMPACMRVCGVFVFCWGLNPGLHTSKANALLLNYIPRSTCLSSLLFCFSSFILYLSNAWLLHLVDHTTFGIDFSDAKHVL